MKHSIDLCIPRYRGTYTEVYEHRNLEYQQNDNSSSDMLPTADWPAGHGARLARWTECNLDLVPVTLEP